MLSLYETLKGVVDNDELDTYFSDIHVEYSPKVAETIKDYFKKLYPDQPEGFGWKSVTSFKNQITGKKWLSIPGGYFEYFDKKKAFSSKCKMKNKETKKEKRDRILKQLKYIKNGQIEGRHDSEHDHAEADDLLLELIDDPEIKEAYESIDMWYG